MNTYFPPPCLFHRCLFNIPKQNIKQKSNFPALYAVILGQRYHYNRIMRKFLRGERQNGDQNALKADENKRWWKS